MGKLLGRGGQLFSLPVGTTDHIHLVRREELHADEWLIDVTELGRSRSQLVIPTVVLQPACTARPHTHTHGTVHIQPGWMGAVTWCTPLAAG